MNKDLIIGQIAGQAKLIREQARNRQKDCFKSAKSFAKSVLKKYDDYAAGNLAEYADECLSNYGYDKEYACDSLIRYLEQYTDDVIRTILAD